MHAEWYKSPCSPQHGITHPPPSTVTSSPSRKTPLRTSSKMYKVLFCLLACLVLLSSAQLTFTSSWGGKRAAIAGSLNCRNDDAVAAVYKLIQNEAEKLLFCQKP